MKTPREMHAQIIEKATADESFRGKLLSAPKTSIEGELGITMPAGVTIEVHENTAQTVHLVLPPTTKLSDTEMKAMGGGGSCGAFCKGGCGY